MATSVTKTQGQSFSLTGQLKDTNGNPFAGGSVQARNFGTGVLIANSQTTSDANGNYTTPEIVAAAAGNFTFDTVATAGGISIPSDDQVQLQVLPPPQPTATINPTSVPANGAFVITGSGFAANSPITYAVNGVNEGALITTDPTGSFVYDGHAGSVATTDNFVFTDGSGNQASATLIVTGGPLNPVVDLTPDQVLTGSLSTISGSGFAPNSPLTISGPLESGSLGVNTNSAGAFTDGTLMSQTAGQYQVTITDGQGNSASATLTVNQQSGGSMPKVINHWTVDPGTFSTYTSPPFQVKQAGSLIAIWITAHNQQIPLANFSASPGLQFHGPILMNGNGLANLVWAISPATGMYTVTVNLPATDHFKMEGWEIVNYGTDSSGNPWGPVTSSGPDNAATFSVPIHTLNANDLVIARFEQEPESTGTNNVLNTYTPISPWATEVENLGLFYSQAEVYFVASFTSPQNSTMNVATSSLSGTGSQWGGAAISVFAGSGPPATSIQFSSNPVTAGAQFTLSGSGFAPSSALTLNGSASLGSTDSSGSFSVTQTATTVPGNYVYTVRDASGNQAQATLTVQGTTTPEPSSLVVGADIATP